MRLARVLLALVVLAFAGAAAVRAGEPGMSGIASHYGPGSGVAMHFCTWELRHGNGCGWVRIQSAQTGLVVEAPVIDYCECVVPGSAHPERLVDLQWGVVAALGLERSQGLCPVVVWLIPDGPLFLADTAVAEPTPDPLAAFAVVLVAGYLVGQLRRLMPPWWPEQRVDEHHALRQYMRGADTETPIGWLP